MSFFTDHPVLYPWPVLLRQSGFKYTYKPREVFWQKEIKKLNLKPGEKVMDVGCGDGIMLDRLGTEYKVSGFGIDPDKKSIWRAGKNCFYCHRLVTAKAEKIPFNNSWFDAIVSFDSLEHIKNQDLALSEIARVLKPGGRLFIYTINKQQKWTLNWWLNKLGIDIYNRVEHDPELFLEPKKVTSELEKNNIKVKPVVFYNSFFTLLADEVVMLLVLLLAKSGLNQAKFHRFGKIVLVVLTGLSKIINPFLHWLDTPWRKKGLANSFCLTGEKR